MTTLGIRRWMLLSLLALLIVPVFLFNVASALLGSTPWWAGASQSPAQSQALDTAGTAIVAGNARWGDSAWQRDIGEQLTNLGVAATIRDSHGQVIYQGGPAPQAGPPWASNWNGGVNPDRQIVVTDGGQPLGTVDLTAITPHAHPSGAALAALFGLLLTLVGVGWLLGRYVVRPLEATSEAARRIAGGNLDFELPASRVKEVAEVRAAFLAMGQGLEESIERQAELEEQRRFFIGAIAHDLRTPLFALRGYLAGLEQGLATSPEKAARYIAVCRQKADQLDRLVSDLFSYARAEYVDQALQREQLSIGDVLASVVDAERPRAQAKGVALTLDGPDEGCLIEGDAHLLERAFGNLLDNALRHTSSGGTITLRWRAEAGRVTVSVADTGPGIAPEDLPHLFEPLYRGDASRSPETGGAGLGLTIARRILRAHGGDLAAANRPDGGAEFTGWLSCQGAAPVIDQSPGDAARVG